MGIYSSILSVIYQNSDTDCGPDEWLKKKRKEYAEETGNKVKHQEISKFVDWISNNKNKE